MKKTVLLFGLASGALTVTVMVASLPLARAGNLSAAEIIGYTSILLSALLVFFGVRSYRQKAGGRLSFGRGLAVGVLIAAVASTCYALTWGALCFWVMPDLPDRLAAGMVARAKAAGAGDRRLAAAAGQAESFRRLEANPALNLAEAFAEPFPVGLLASLLAAAILRRRAPGPQSVGDDLGGGAAGPRAFGEGR